MARIFKCKGIPYYITGCPTKQVAAVVAIKNRWGVTPGDLIRKSNGIYIRRHKYLSAIVDASTVCMFTELTDKNGTPIYEEDIVIYRDNNTERRGSINWDSKAAAFCFGQDFLVHYPSENMVVVGNKFDKEK